MKPGLKTTVLEFFVTCPKLEIMVWIQSSGRKFCWTIKSFWRIWNGCQHLKTGRLHMKIWIPDSSWKMIWSDPHLPHGNYGTIKINLVFVPSFWHRTPKIGDISWVKEVSFITYNKAFLARPEFILMKWLKKGPLDRFRMGPITTKTKWLEGWRLQPHLPLLVMGEGLKIELNHQWAVNESSMPMQ